MERADQAVQARQRQSAPHPVPGRVTEHSPENISLWGLLPAPGGSGHEKGHGRGGSHAQNVACRRPSHSDGGELRSWESGHAGRELDARLAPCLHGAPHTLMLERHSLWTLSRGQGKRFARERHHSLFTVRVFGIAWTRDLTNSMASSQEAFADRIGSRCVIGCVENLNCTGCRHMSEAGPKFAVVITNQILRILSKRGGFSKLLGHPGIGRGSSDADMDHPSCLELDDEDREERSKEEICDL